MDINNDGVDDIISGEYFGKITLYKGLKQGGTTPPVEIEQKLNINNKDNFYQYMYANPSFGDYNNDGLWDAFVGGARGLRVMLNSGTKENPIFDVHRPLLGIDEKPIFHRNLTESDFEGLNKNFSTPDYATHIYFTDWNNDGVKDILSVSDYSTEGEDAIVFHKGATTPGGIRFEKGIPLFTAKDGGKSLPGTYLRASFVDINGDGTMDILLGAKVITDDKGNFIPELNYLYSNKVGYYEKKQKYLKDNNIEKEGARGYIIMILGKKHYK